jgi:anti-anti-sigma factor
LETVSRAPAGPSGPALQITPLGDGTGFELAGALDLATVAEARSRVEAILRPGAEVTFDLARLEFMDSTGLNLFLVVLRAVGDDGRLVLRGTRGLVRRVLKVSGLEDRPNLVLLD